MMMSLPEVTKNSRRQPTTYGKASRRTLRALEISIANGKGDVSRLNEDESGRKIVGQTRDDEIVASTAPYSRSQKFQEDRSDDMISPGSTATESSASVYKNAIFDISSDDELSAPLDLRIGSKKRRKLDNIRVEDSAQAGWGDASLQEHFGVERGEPLPHEVKLLDYGNASGVKSSKSCSVACGGSLGRARERPPVTTGQRVGINPGSVARRAKTLFQPRIMQHQQMPQHQAGLPVRADCAKLKLYLEVEQPLSSTKHATRQPVMATLDTHFMSTKDKVPQKSSMDDYYLTVKPDATEVHTHTIINGKPPRRSRHLHTSDRQTKRPKSEQNLLAVTKVSKDQRTGHMTTPRPKIKDRLRETMRPPDISDSEGKEEGEDGDTRLSSIPSSDRILGNHKIQNNEASCSTSEAPRIRSQNSSQPGTRLQSNGPKFTYAHQRSYLVEGGIDGGAMLNMSFSHSESRQTSSMKAETRSQSNKSETLTGHVEELEDPAWPQSLAMQSIHELRQAGGNARVIGEIEALLDEIDPSNSVPPAVRRGGLLDISNKLQQPDFCRQFLDRGLETRLVDQISGITDDVASILILTGIVQLLAHSNSPHLLLQLTDGRIMTFLGQQIDKSEDLATMMQLRKVNMSKALQMDMRSFCAAFPTSSVWRNGRPTQITGRILSLQCLEFLVRHARECGSTYDILPRNIIDKLVDFFAARKDGSAPPLDNTDIIVMRLALAILETLTMTQPVSSDNGHSLWKVEYVPKLEELLVMVQGLQGDAQGDLRTLALRLCLNVTNNSPVLCEGFSSLAFISTSVALIEKGFRRLSNMRESTTQALVLDDMVLSLGLLINLAEWSKTIRKLFIVKREPRPAALDTLLQLFQANLARTSEATSEEETLLNVPFGYLSVLLCFLSISTSVRRQVRSQLRSDKLDQLLGAAEEFLHYHRQIAEEIRQLEDSGNVKVSFVHRLQSVVDRLRCEEA